ERHEVRPLTPPPVLAEPNKTYEPNAGGGAPMAYTQSRTAELDSAARAKLAVPSDKVPQSDHVAESNHAAAVQPAPAAAPSVATPAAPPPAPAVAAGVANEPKRVRTVDVPPAPAAPSFMARRAPLDRQQPRVDDRVAALAIASEQKRLSPGPVAQASS